MTARKEPRINVYVCEYGCLNTTVDVDYGVTPFMIKCRTKARPDRPLKPELTGPDGECIGTAQSSFYPRGPKPPWIPEPTHEWYRPTQEEVATMEHGEEIWDHVKNGGLILRERSKAEPVYHDTPRPAAPRPRFA